MDSSVCMHRGQDKRRDVPPNAVTSKLPLPPDTYHIVSTMNPNDKFKVIARGVEFTLVRSQIEFDSPNFFTACFLGDFQESQTRTLEISRDPVLFGIVYDYLCGYTVIPLDESVIPARMSPATALINLRVDAEFYQLDGLIELCSGKSTNPALGNNTECVVIGGTNTNNWYTGTLFGFLFVDCLTAASPMLARDIISFINFFERFHIAYLSKEKVLKDFPTLTTPQSCEGFQGVIELAAITKVACREFKSYDRKRWTMLGWYTGYPVKGELLIILEEVVSI